VAACLGASPAAAGATAWRPGTRAARAYAATRQGDVRWQVRTPQRTWSEHARHAAPSASLVKAMLLAAYARRHRDRPFTGTERALLAPMIRRSDDVAATAIRNRLRIGALTRFARRAGMTGFHEDPVWGMSTSSPRDQTRLWIRIDRVVPRRHRDYAMRLLAHVTPSQRWGIAEVAPAGWSLAFKGGWGSGSGAVEHQSALLTRGGQRLALSVMITGSPSHAYAKRTLRGVFARLVRGLPSSAP
jgi:Beta-lactamase enzyme family